MLAAELARIPIRDLDTLPAQLISRWYGDLYNELLQQQRTGPLGVYTKDPASSPHSKTGTACLVRFDDYEAGKHEYLFDF